MPLPVILLRHRPGLSPKSPIPCIRRPALRMTCSVAQGSTWQKKAATVPSLVLATLCLGVLLVIPGTSMATSVASHRDELSTPQNVFLPSVFIGSYSDPFHPGCTRSISAKGRELIVSGSDQKDGSSPWSLQATQSQNTILVDFSPKGGPANLRGEYNEEKSAIVWQDGNSWTKIQ